MLTKTAAPPHDELRPFYPAKRFSGSLVHNELRVSCGLTAEVTNSGKLRIDIEDIPINVDTWPLYDADTVGPRFPLYSLDAVSDDGDRLLSDDLYFTRAGTHSDTKGSYFSYSGACSQARILTKRGRPGAPSTITYWLRGFRSFGSLRTGSAFGQIGMGGTDCSDTATISGALHLEATEAEIVSVEENWRGALALLDHVLWIMSFASGTLLKDPVRVFEHNDTAEIEVQSRSVSPRASLAPFYHMHLQPIFERAVSSYSDRREECYDLRIALHWLLMDAGYTELRLLGLAIALEYLVGKALNKKERRRFEDAAFDEMMCRLRIALDASALSDKEKDYIVGAVTNRNFISFPARITKLLDKWQISMHDLPADTVRQLVSIRDAVAHRGHVRGKAKGDEVDLWELMLLAREVVTRIILSRIGYVGRYRSFVGGQHDRYFPSCERHG